MSPAKRFSTAKGSDAKKIKKTPLEENLAVLTSAFNNFEYEFPCVESLKDLIPNTLSTPVELRHEYQIKAFSMVEEAVCEAQSRLQTQLDNFQTEVTNSDKLKQEMDANVLSTETDIQTEEERVDAMTDCVKEATARLTEGQNNLDAELESLEKERVDYDQHQADYEELNSKFVELFLDGALKSSIPQVTGCRKSLEKLIKQFITVTDELSPVIQSAFVALSQEPKARTAFDKRTLDLFEDIFENRLSDIQKDIVRTKPDFSKRDALQQEVENLTQVLEGEQGKLDATKNGHKVLVAKLRDIKKNLKNHPQSVKDAEDGLTNTAEILETFQQTVVPANSFIQQYTDVVEVPAEVEQEAEAAVTSADACVVDADADASVAAEEAVVVAEEAVVVAEDEAMAEIPRAEEPQTGDISMSTPIREAKTAAPTDIAEPTPMDITEPIPTDITEPTPMDSTPLENAAFNTPRDTMKLSQEPSVPASPRLDAPIW